MEEIEVIMGRDKVSNGLQQYSFHPLLQRFRAAEEQHDALMKALIEDKEVQMALAVINEGIVGYTLILQPETNERWSLLEYIKVLGAIEVADPYRQKGLAKKLIHAVCSDPFIEDYIVLSLEYAWHWDLKIVNWEIDLYKQFLKELLESEKFKETTTDEPDIAYYKHNFMMARIGRNITSDQINEFMKLANLHSIY